jgi:predicted nucleic-acid-binding Zn-ribbon protein
VRDAEFEELLEASSLGAPHVKAAQEGFSVYRPPAPDDDVEERCPECESTGYGPVDIAWPFERPEQNPPNVSYVVGVCRNCGYTTDSNE